jgi:hypothetical protein
MQIHQLSVTYQAEQDRVLLRVNSTSGEEMRLWLTRRLMLGLWPLLTKLQTDQVLKMESAGAEIQRADEELRSMLAEFRKEELLQRADFQTPYQDKPNLPLGAEPLLVTDVDASPLPNGPAAAGLQRAAAAGAGRQAARLPGRTRPQAHARPDAPAGPGARPVGMARRVRPAGPPQAEGEAANRASRARATSTDQACSRRAFVGLPVRLACQLRGAATAGHNPHP